MKTNIMKLSVIVTIVIITIILLFYDSVSYDESLIEKQIAADLDLSNLKIRNMKDLDDIRAIVFTAGDNDIGHCILTRNVIGRYKIDITGNAGTSRLFICIIDRIYDKNYFCLVGKNEGKITNAVIHITGLDNQDKPIAFDEKVIIPDEEYFVMVEEMKSTYSIDGDYSDNTQFYDKNGKNVTRELLNY